MAELDVAARLASGELTGDLTVEERGHVLAACIVAALKNGCRHYDAAGHLLESPASIVHALASGTGVTVDERDRRDVTTVEAELERMRRPELAARVRPRQASARGADLAERLARAMGIVLAAVVAGVLSRAEGDRALAYMEDPDARPDDAIVGICEQRLRNEARRRGIDDGSALRRRRRAQRRT